MPASRCLAPPVAVEGGHPLRGAAAKVRRLGLVDPLPALAQVLAEQGQVGGGGRRQHGLATAEAVLDERDRHRQELVL
jgi:hypothetical protein